LIGCGNMARALARGWRRPLVCADPLVERARALAAEVGGEALQSNLEVARRAELVVLCHKPAQLREVAGEIGPHARAVASSVAEAQVEAGVRRGIAAEDGARLVVQTLAGTAELLRRRGYDTVAVRREVTSPGGLTARGLAALERAGLRSAFSDALDAVLARSG